MPWLTQLDDVARRTGFPVTVVSGWAGRGHGPQPEVRGIVCHHTAGPSGGGDYPSLRVVRDGRPGLDGPLSHFGLGRSGRIYVIAAGRCWHNAPSTSAAHDNSSAIGIEAENNGVGQRWPAVQVRAYEALCAELCREFGLSASAVKGHKEVQIGKPDPRGVDMDGFRAEVARLIRNPGTRGEEDDPMPEYEHVTGSVKELPPGEWATVTVDSSGWKNGPYRHVLDGPARVHGYAYAKARSPEGSPLQLHVRVVETKDGGSTLLEDHPWGEGVAAGGSTPVFAPFLGDLQDGRDLRVQVEHWGPAPVDVDVTVRLHYWER